MRSWNKSLRNCFGTCLYLLGVHDGDREVEGAQHYIGVCIAIVWRHLWCSLGGRRGSTVGRGASWAGARLGGWRRRPLHKVDDLAAHIWDDTRQLWLHMCITETVKTCQTGCRTKCCMQWKMSKNKNHQHTPSLSHHTCAHNKKEA